MECRVLIASSLMLLAQNYNSAFGFDKVITLKVDDLIFGHNAL